jgi:hypothetical protein
MLKMRRWLVLLMFAAVAANVAYATKNPVWLDGKVLDTERNRYFAGTISNSSESGSIYANGNSGSYQGTTSGSNVAVYRVYANYVIDGGDKVYLLEERLHFRWSKAANLTVNGPIKYYVDGRKMHFLDDQGKERTAEIIKKTLKQL